MNPLLGRLFENRTRSKTKPIPSEEHRRNQSFDRTLVPKLPTKIKLEALPEAQAEKRMSTLARSNMGILPVLNFYTTNDMRENIKTRTKFRHRKLSTTIKDMQANIFTTQLEDKLTMQITPQLDLKMFQVQSKQKEQVSKIQDKTQQRQRAQEEVFQYLNVLQNHADLNEEFCYMNRRSLPYSFYIVDYQDRDKDEHLTVSLRGITYYNQDQNEFYTISKFAQEIQKYKQIKQIYFFREYLKAKVINHWKRIMLRRKFNLKCKYITSHLFSQNQQIQEYLHFLHYLAEDYSGGSFFNFNITLTLSLAQFKKAAENGSNQIMKSIRKFDSLIQKTLKSTLQKMLTRFRTDERVTIGSQKHNQQDEAYLPFDKKRRSMKYTQMAKLKEFQWMMYRIIKYTDMVRFNVKLVIIRRCFANSILELRSLKKASQSKETVRFTNWVQMSLILQGQAGSASLLISPSIQQLEQAVLNLKSTTLAQIFKDHKLIIEKKDTLFCENIEFEDQEKQKPTKHDLKYYVLKQPEFQVLQNQFQLSLKEIITEMENYLFHSVQILLKIYNKNALVQDVSSYLSNSALKSYLQIYRQDYNRVADFEDPAQFALALVKAGKIKEQVRRLAEQKYKIIAYAVPNEVIRRCNLLDENIRKTFSPIKENPHNVRAYISFISQVHQQQKMIENLQGELDKILQFELLVYKYNIRIGEQAKLCITDVQALMKQLLKRFDEIEQNQEKQRKKFQQMVDQMIPLIGQKSQELLNHIRENKLINNHATDVTQATSKVRDFMENYNKIKVRKQQLFQYQTQLNLGHRELQVYDKMQNTIKCYEQVWTIRTHFVDIMKKTHQCGYSIINELDVQPLNQFIQNLQLYSTHLECFDLLNQFKQTNLALLKVITISKLLAAETLMSQHIARLKEIIKAEKGSTIKVELMFSRESKSTITPQQIIKETNVLEIEDEISDVVYFSSQESIAKAQLNQIQEFWRKNKVKLIQEDIAQNQLPILHLQKNQELQQVLGQFVVTLKNLQNSPHVVGTAKNRTVANSHMCIYLRDLLWSWQKVEKQWINLLPIMANSQAVKHQSNVFFEFTSSDSVIKKFIRQVSEMSSLKRLCEDYNDRRFMNTLQQIDRQLQVINKAFMNFLQLKRVTYGRFCFISDYELIQILQHAKDAQSASKYVSYCFNAQKLQLDGLLMCAFQHKNEIYNLRKIALKGQPDQIFKAIEENMKYSLKFVIKVMLPKFKMSANSQSVFKQCSTQTILVSDHLFWTEMTQNYLTTSSYEEYKLLLKKQEERIATDFKAIEKKLWLQTAIRLTQLMHFKEIGMELIRDQITVNDFKWKEQIRMYLNEEDIIVSHFDYKMNYGCEYRPPVQIDVPTNTSTRFLFQSFRACHLGLIMTLSGNEDLLCKRQLVEQASGILGTYSREVICSNRLSANFLLKIVQGVIAAGAWSTFYEFQNLNYSVCAQFLSALSKPNTTQHKSSPYLFMLAYDTPRVQQISLYSFTNYAVVQPDKERICQWLFQLYKFQHFTQLAHRTLHFFKIAKPFLNKALSSELGWIKQVVMKAGNSLLNLDQDYEETSETYEFRIVTQALKDEVIFKQQETKLHCLSKALYACFGGDIIKDTHASHFQQKIETLIHLLQSQSRNIIVLGQRSCKSQVIKQSLKRSNLSSIWLFPNATQIFFSPETIDFLGKIPQNQVIIYDGNEIISQWSDLVTAGFLLMEGKKATLRNKTIMQLRSIDHYSPSFVSQCQILYMGNNVVSKWVKMSKIIDENHLNFDSYKQILTDLFGNHLQNIEEQHLLTICQLLGKIKATIPNKSIQKIVVWFMALLGHNYHWNKYFGGQILSFMMNSNYQLVVPQAGLSLLNPYPGYKNYLIVPTKQTTVMLYIINSLLQANRQIHVVGTQQSGKTTLTHLLNRSLVLPSNATVQKWSQSLKKRFTFVRRDHQNILIDFQKEGTLIVVDDLDLGNSSHEEYLRGQFESLTFRDKHFQLYTLQKIQFVGFSRPGSYITKYWSNVTKISLPEMQKQSVQLIYTQNIGSMIADYSMNRQVQQLLNNKIQKAALIVIEDLCNLITVNQASALMLSLLRNLMSLPKKQAYISAQNYTKFFKTHFHSKLHELSTNSKLLWQVNSIEHNILKVIFGDSQSKDFSLNIDGQYRSLSKSQLEQTIKKIYPHMVVFDRLLDGIAYICNQIRCMDRSIVLLGKRGTGKHFLVDLCSKLTNIPILHSFSDAVISALKYQKVILADPCENDITLYQNLIGCRTRKDLQKYIDNDKRELFNTLAVGESEQIKFIERCLENISFIFNSDDKDSYQNLTKRMHSIHNMPVCLLEEWPASAILNIYNIKDPNPNLHAHLFTKINATLTQMKITTFSLKSFQKYLKVYDELVEKGRKSISSILKLNQDVYKKFNQSFELVTAWEKRVDILRVQIEDSIMKSGQNIVANEVANMCLTIFLDQIKQQEQKSGMQQEELKILNRQIQLRLQFIKSTLRKIQKIISSFQRTEMGELKKVYKMSKITFFGVQCLCILLNEEDSQQKTINKILADPNLLMRMKSNEILENRNRDLQKKIKNQFDQLRIDLQNSDSQLSKSLIQWILSLIQYWEACDKQKTEKERYSKAKDALEQSIRKHEQLKGQVICIKKIIEQKIRIVEFELDQKAKNQQQLASITKKLDIANNLIPILKKEELQALQIIRYYEKIEINLRGNCILAAVAASFVPMQPLIVKQKLLAIVKEELESYSVKYSQNFISELSHNKINSLQNLNIFLLEQCSLRKLVYDPQRKFLLYLQEHSTVEMRQSIIENSQSKKELQVGKIYHVTSDFVENKENILVIDWTAIAIQEKEMIFLKLAQFKRPEYFLAKKQLEGKINRNLIKVQLLKEDLYKILCEKEMKIIEDQSVIELEEELQKLQKENEALKFRAQQKKSQIRQLTESINEQVKKIIQIYQTLKFYKPFDIELILDICCRQGDAVSNFIKWSLTNISKENSISFIFSCLIAFKNQKNSPILKDIIKKTPLKAYEGHKIKKPALVGAKYWQIALKLSSYGGNLKRLPEEINKMQKQFEQWCIYQDEQILPAGFYSQNIDFLQNLALVYHFKPRTFGYLAHQLIQKYFPYNLQRFSSKQMLGLINDKFPIIMRHSLKEIKKLSNQMNEGRYSLVRVSKLAHQNEMKRVVWKSMESKEWLICYDIQTKKDLLMMESICYYVMNYDKQEGFRVVIAIDNFGQINEMTKQQKLIKSSAFLSGVCPQIYPEVFSCDKMLAQNGSIEYQMSMTGNHSVTTNKILFNKIFKMIVICFNAIRRKYPALKFSFKRLLQILQYIKFRQIPLQFNVFTIVQYLSRVMSYQIENMQVRKEIEQLWESIVNQKKVKNTHMFGIPLEELKIDSFTKNNFQIFGCQKSYHVRQCNRSFDSCLQQLFKMFKSDHDIEQSLIFLRTQINKLPVIITGKEMIHKNYSYFYDNQLSTHNKMLARMKQLLENLDVKEGSEHYLQKSQNADYHKIQNILATLSQISHQTIPINSLQLSFTALLNKIKKQHQFLLYFNPTAHTLLIDPYILMSVQLLISSRIIDFLQKESTKIAHTYTAYLELKETSGNGMYFINLKCKQFNYNSQMKTIGPSLQADGLENSAFVELKFKQKQQDDEQQEQQEIDDLDVEISTANGDTLYWGTLQYKTVFREWILRGCKLLAGPS